MNQSERRNFLIQSLLEESREYRGMQIPSDSTGQRQLLRGLMNVRMVKKSSAEFLNIQDAYLQEETAKKGVTDVDDLTPVQQGLYLWQGDITALRCDAIVNAANSGMTGCYVPNHRCIDNCIHTFAGVQLRLYCEEMMEAQGHAEPTGQAKITPAYNLPCRYVLHTVGPIVGGHLTETHCRQLADCYRMRNSSPPATAPAWNWQRKTIWKAWRSAAFPLENFIFRTRKQRRLPLRR